MTIKSDSTVKIITKFEISATAKDEVIGKLAEELNKKGFVTNCKGFIEDVDKREKVLPTYIGHSIGLPHTKSKFVKRPAVIVGRLKNSIVWNEDNTVKLIFLIAVPKETNSNLHLKILANLARMLMHNNFREKLMQLNEKEVQELIYESMNLTKGGGTNE